MCRIAWGAEFISGLHYILPLRSLVYFSTQLFCRLSDSISLLLPLILCFPVSTSYCEPFFNQKCAKKMGHLLALDAIEDESNPSMNYQKHGIFFLLCTFLFQYYPQHMQFPPGNCSNSVCKKTAKGHRLLIFREKNNGREVPIKIRVSPCCCCFVGQLKTQCSYWKSKTEKFATILKSFSFNLSA